MFKKGFSSVKISYGTAQHFPMPLNRSPRSRIGRNAGREREKLSLRWTQVDLENRTIRLEPGETKNDEARIIPVAGELLDMLLMQK